MSTPYNARGFKTTIDEYINYVSITNSKEEILLDKMDAIDLEMHNNYNAYRQKIATKITPVIVVTFDFFGGRYHLVKDGNVTSVSPVPHKYSAFKSCSHIPLGIMNIVGEYLQIDCKTDVYVPKLKHFLETIKNAEKDLKDGNWKDEEFEPLSHVLTNSIKFIESILTKGSMTHEEYTAFTTSIKPSIKKNMKFSSLYQDRAVLTLLNKWKKELGETEWSKLHAVVLAIWPVMQKNAHEVCLKKVMDPKYVDERLIISPATVYDRDNVVSQGLDTLARVVMDRLIARLVFVEKELDDKILINSLSSEQDIMGNVTEETCNEIAKEVLKE
eukprot:gene11885-5212_t